MLKKSKGKKTDKQFAIPGIFDDEPPTYNEADLENELHELIGADLADDENQDSEGDVDENDPKLLAELDNFLAEPTSSKKGKTNDSTAVSTSIRSTMPESSDASDKASLEEVRSRLNAYNASIEALKTKQPVDSAKIRRYERQVQQLESFASKLSMGKVVLINELPDAPAAIVGLPANTGIDASNKVNMVLAKESNDLQRPTEATLSTKVPSERMQQSERAPTTRPGLDVLRKRQSEYKDAALKARDSGQLDRAKALLEAYKFICDMLPQVESGKVPFDPQTDMPPSPDAFCATLPAPQSSTSETVTAPTNIVPPNTQSLAALQTSTVTAENLQLRMDYYKARLEEAMKNPSESSKQRRINRVVKHYEEATRAFKGGIVTYNYTELPEPPGCPKLSNPTRLPTASSVPGSRASQLPVTSNANDSVSGKRERVIELLTKRQSELKQAALQAKQAGNINQAKIYLCSSHDIDPMIESVRAGVQIDFSKLPAAPKAGVPNIIADRLPNRAGAFTGPVLTGIACDPPTKVQLELANAETRMQKMDIILRILEEQAKTAQLFTTKLSKAGMSELAEKLSELAEIAQYSTRLVKTTISENKFVDYKFELANFPQLNMNPELGENSLEVCVLRGNCYKIPSDISDAEHLNTYVELSLPYPSNDSAQKFSTDWSKHSADPKYVSNAVTIFEVDLKSRSYLRFIQSNRELKATVYYNRGLLKKYGELGTASFPVADLIHRATVDLTADLMEGRRAVGGNLEVRLRQRNSISGPKLSSVKEPWLIIEIPKRATQPSSANAPVPHTTTGNRISNL